MEFYRQHPSDPDWLAKAAAFHGHLGPWVTVGAMIGHDARKRLATPGYWNVEIVCWMPPDKQRTPFSCILDGLQATTGATLGKQNIRFAWSPKVSPEGRPVVHVIRRPDRGQPASGLVYRVNDRLADTLSRIDPRRLEQISRRIAAHDPPELLNIRPMADHELALSAALPTPHLD